jgi:hypothetical protein
MTTIYRFTVYNIATDQVQKFKRWGTAEAIGSIGGAILMDTATEVDPSVLSSTLVGMTEPGFNPARRTDFQRQVMP